MENINLENIANVVDELSSNDVTNVHEQTDEFVFHTIEDYEKIEDNFIRYRVMVNDAIELYEHARLMAAVSDTGLSASIYRMAEPFRKGHFTLAVVGKMSAGKSTFINALLGDKDLLPTGYFQTTCTLTTISHSENRMLYVIYGDYRQETISENIAEALAKLVAIDPKYNSLPVNNVNRLILSDVSKEEICSEKLIKEMERLSKSKIDIELLKEYVEEHPKEKIPMEVAIECPLSENYRGWRIVDTPGVDAIGGIEDDTRKFLCGKDEEGNHNVDAIIFIQAAKGDIQSKSLNDFVSDTIGDLTEEAKKRAFFVLTHASNPDFITRKDEIMQLAKELFVDYAHVGDDSRLIAVDGLASLLENDLKLDFKSLVSVKTPAPSHWNYDVWKDCRNLIKLIKALLEDDEDAEFNNENARNKLRELANFDTFRGFLNEFVKQEKNKAFSDIVDTIEKDIKACISIRKQDIRILEANLGKSPQEFLEDLEKEKGKLDQFQVEANLKFAEFSKNYGKSKVDERFKEGGLADILPEVFKSKPSLREMREKAEELGNVAETIANGIQDSIVEDINDFVEISQQSKDFVLPPIDFRAVAHRVETKAREDGDKTREERREKAVTTTGNFYRARFSNWLRKRGFDSNWGYEVWYETIHYTDMELAAISFCKSLREEMDNYRAQIADKIIKLIDLIDKDIKDAIEKRKEDYEAMAENMALVDQIDKKNGEIEHLQTAISNLGIYHF